MSLMMVSRASPLLRMVSAKSRCSGVRSVSSNNPVMPITAFIGVRISWLIIAKNSPLARLAAFASLVACSRACWAWRRSVASSPTESILTRLPCSSRNALFVHSNQTRSPLRRMFSCSWVMWCSGCWITSWSMAARSLPWLSIGGRMVPRMLCPRMSSSL